MVLDIYTLPTVMSAQLYGRRHATLLVMLLWHFDPELFVIGGASAAEWVEITVWGGTLIVTGYFMGSLCERKDAQVKELGETYHGIPMILRHFISKDKYTDKHPYRVSVYVTKVAAQLDLDNEHIEDIRSAGLLHDIGKQILYKAALLTANEFSEAQEHVEKGISLLEPVGGSLRRILPITLSHLDKFNRSGYHPAHGQESPLEAHIISVTDVFDSLTSDRPYRKAMSPFEVREILVKGPGASSSPRSSTRFSWRSGRAKWRCPRCSSDKYGLGSRRRAGGWSSVGPRVRKTSPTHGRGRGRTVSVGIRRVRRRVVPRPARPGRRRSARATQCGWAVRAA